MVCEAFGCTPLEAKEQDWHEVQAILDYRAAERARDLFNSPNKSQAFDELKANPYLTELLSRMHRAQVGAAPQGDAEEAQREGLQIAAALRSDDDDGADGDRSPAELPGVTPANAPRRPAGRPRAGVAGPEGATVRVSG